METRYLGVPQSLSLLAMQRKNSVVKHVQDLQTILTRNVCGETEPRGADLWKPADATVPARLAVVHANLGDLWVVSLEIRADTVVRQIVKTLTTGRPVAIPVEHFQGPQEIAGIRPIGVTTSDQVTVTAIPPKQRVVSHVPYKK
jgi:hypothetical protein